jgi:hypothetical protein
VIFAAARGLARLKEEERMDGDQACPHQLSRAEIYERVWTTPMRTLAAEFGVSDVGLSKLCHRHHVPTPPRGYWAMKQNGRELPRPRLPHAGTAAAEIVVIQRSSGKAESTIPESERFEIVVPNELVDPHPLIERTVSSLRAASPKADGRVTPRAKTALPVTVGPASIDRAAGILDTLVRGLEARGHRIEVTGPEHGRKIVVEVSGEEIGIVFGEKVDQERLDPTPTGNRNQTPDAWAYRQPEQYRQFPSGRLFLRMDAYYGFGMRTQWSDGRRQRVEKRLGAFIMQLETLAARIKKQREDQAEAERRRQATGLGAARQVPQSPRANATNSAMHRSGGTERKKRTSAPYRSGTS